MREELSNVDTRYCCSLLAAQSSGSDGLRPLHTDGSEVYVLEKNCSSNETTAWPEKACGGPTPEPSLEPPAWETECNQRGRL